MTITHGGTWRVVSVGQHLSLFCPQKPPFLANRSWNPCRHKYANFYLKCSRIAQISACYKKLCQETRCWLNFGGRYHVPQNVFLLLYFSMRMPETALFLLLVWNLTSPSCFSTPISYETRKFRRFTNISGRNWHICVCVDFQHLLAHNGGLWGQNRGRAGAMLTATNSFLLLGIFTSVPLLAKIDQEMRQW